MIDIHQNVGPVLAADCGGTRTRVRLYDGNGIILGEGSAGPSNLGLGASNTINQIKIASMDAIKSANFEGKTLNQFVVFAGIASLITKQNKQALEKTPHPFKELNATTDAHTALLGAFNGEDGGILILGTGSCGFGQVKGKLFNIGGWGFSISDQGSGARLGYLAVRLAVQSFDKIKPTSPLSNLILRKLGGSPQSAYHWSQTAKPSDYGALAPIVFDAARQNDESALSLLKTLCAEIEEMIAAMQKRGCHKIALVGGLAAVIKEYLPDNLRPHLVDAEKDALWGAYLLQNDKETNSDLVRITGCD
ncbi:MAG: BadF/BadG/BcrA/BcrD ATPase family protein [Sneathiella sp.]